MVDVCFLGFSLSFWAFSNMTKLQRVLSCVVTRKIPKNRTNATESFANFIFWTKEGKKPLASQEDLIIDLSTKFERPKSTIISPKCFFIISKNF